MPASTNFIQRNLALTTLASRIPASTNLLQKTASQNKKRYGQFSVAQHQNKLKSQTYCQTKSRGSGKVAGSASARDL
jgi:hypothetical protein